MRHILQIVTTLEAGGAQVLLLDVAERLDPERFRTTVAFLHRGRELRRSADARGLAVLDLSRNDRYDPLALPRLARWIRREQVALVHTHLVHAGVVGKLAARMTGTPAVTTRHYGVHRKRRRLFYRMEDRLTGGAAATIAVSESVRETLLRDGVAPAERIHVIPNGVDLRRWEPLDTPPRDRGATSRVDAVDPTGATDGNVVRIGAVGRLQPEKGMDVFLEACALLARQGAAFHAEIVGEGSERARLQDQARSLGLEDRVRFRGFIERHALPDVMRCWDIVVQPSRREAFGIAVVEAMSLAKPVVATRTEGIPEILSDGENGRLVPAGDARVLSVALAELARAPEERARLGQAARADAAHRFSIEVTVRRLEGLYASILGDGQQTGPDRARSDSAPVSASE